VTLDEGLCRKKAKKSKVTLFHKTFSQILRSGEPPGHKAGGTKTNQECLSLGKTGDGVNGKGGVFKSMKMSLKQKAEAGHNTRGLTGRGEFIPRLRKGGQIPGKKDLKEKKTKKGNCKNHVLKKKKKKFQRDSGNLGGGHRRGKKCHFAP